MLVSEAEKNPEIKMRKASMPNSTLKGISLKKINPLLQWKLYSWGKLMQISRINCSKLKR
jgi:hypothetical protein